MKKLITILFLFAFSLTAQESWKFERDKQFHFGVGAVIATPSLLLLYNATNDWEFSVNGAVWIPAAFAFSKEFLDLLRYIATGTGSGFSIADFCYTVAGAALATLITSYLLKRRKMKWDKKFNLVF